MMGKNTGQGCVRLKDERGNGTSLIHLHDTHPLTLRGPDIKNKFPILENGFKRILDRSPAYNAHLFVFEGKLSNVYFPQNEFFWSGG